MLRAFMFLFVIVFGIVKVLISNNNNNDDDDDDDNNNNDYKVQYPGF